jgi:hypothetical protein
MAEMNICDVAGKCMLSVKGECVWGRSIASQLTLYKPTPALQLHEDVS